MGLKLNYDEGQTPIDEEEKQGLKIKSITTKIELDEFEQLNIEKAIEWTIQSKLKPQNILTQKFVRDLHKKMFSDVWEWAGEFRRTEKNIGISWTRISLELQNLLDDTKYWIDHSTYLPDEIAIRFKHRLVSIHCFANGNGRHSRIMADIIIENVFSKNIFTWGYSNMVKADETRKAYIRVLKEADKGNMPPLIKFARQ